MLNKEFFLKAYPSLLSGSSDCANCFYGLQFDTYQNGCTHDCHYCWAKEELGALGQWNNPKPVPIDIDHFRDLFFTVFETDKPSNLRKILESRVPLRLGSMSDPFLAMEKKYNITYEVLKVLAKYRYPSLILTRSDLVAEDKYLSLFNKDLNTVQFSIPSLNEKLVKILEPGAPPPLQRLEALRKLMEVEIWTTIRLNPLFPIYPDGHFSEKSSRKTETSAQFDFFKLEMIDQMAEYGCKGIITGFAHLNGDTLDLIANKTSVDLRDFMTDEMKLKTSGFKFSAKEIRAYYQVIADRCKKNQIEFSTCYLGLGESFFWKDQNLWADKNDCCNIKNHVKEFKSDTNQLGYFEKINTLPSRPSWMKVLPLFFLNRLGQFIKRNLF